VVIYDRCAVASMRASCRSLGSDLEFSRVGEPLYLAVHLYRQRRFRKPRPAARRLWDEMSHVGSHSSLLFACFPFLYRQLDDTSNDMLTCIPGLAIQALPTRCRHLPLGP
jgi:hypothetical protein